MSKTVFDSHTLIDNNEKPLDCGCGGAYNTPYDPDGSGELQKNNIKLISAVLNETAAVQAGGIEYKICPDAKKVYVFSKGGTLDFCAVGIFDSLGIFDVVISANQKGKVILVIS